MSTFLFRRKSDNQFVEVDCGSSADEIADTFECCEEQGLVFTGKEFLGSLMLIIMYDESKGKTLMLTRNEYNKLVSLVQSALSKYPNESDYSQILFQLKLFIMEISVYGSLDARDNDKVLFRRAVLCPDTFDALSFVSNMKAILGKNVVIEILYV